MRWLRQGLTLLLAVGAVAVGGLFSLQNTYEVPLDLIVFQLPAQPVAIWVLAALAVGVAVGLAAGALLALRRAATIRRLRKERDRLIDARIMRLAQETLAEAEAIANPGPRLQGQIAAAQDTLTYASTPVAVTMTSDGLTDITLLRVKRLGTLAEQTLSLRPGLYTAVGMRNGYRDVRVKFEVRPDQTNAVEVRCVETI